MDTTCSRNRAAMGVRAIAAAILIGAALLAGGFGATYAQEPIPFFRAFPDGNAVDGGNWPLGATIHMAIDDPATTEIAPDYEQDATVIVSPWDWISTYVRFDFDGIYDLKRGDEVTLSAGEISRYLIVPDLWVTTVDPVTNIVAGKAEPGTLVHVFIGGDAELFVTADSEGAWVADFGDVGFDLLPGMSGGAEVWFDDFGDSTIFDWYAHPRYTGHWRAVDSYDQSHMQLTISGGGNNQYRLTWTDDYWSVCGGRPGIGRGTGTPNPGGFLRVNWVIQCQGAVVWEGQSDYFLDIVTGTLWDGANTWYLVGGK